MQTKITKLLIITVLLLSPVLAFAQEGDRDPFSSSYLFYLYYDNGKLSADRDYQFVYDIIPEKFVSDVFDPQASTYKGEIINFKNQIVRVFKFDPQRGDPTFKKGKLSVKAPYFADGNVVNFYNSQGAQLLSISVADSSFCNDDDVCNSNVGEDPRTCPNDCKQALPVPSPSISNQPNSGSSDSMTNVIIYSLISLVVVGVGAGLWFGWKWWKSRRGGNVPGSPPSQEPYLPVK